MCQNYWMEEDNKQALKAGHCIIFGGSIFLKGEQRVFRFFFILYPVFSDSPLLTCKHNDNGHQFAQTILLKKSFELYVCVFVS